MEKEKNLESKSEGKKYKKKKSVNWESKIIKIENDVKEEADIKKPEESKTNEKEFLEIEVINQDGNTVKERVKYETKESKEFAQKRGKIAHDEYTKAKKFLENHKN